MPRSTAVFWARPRSVRAYAGSVGIRISRSPIAAARLSSALRVRPRPQLARDNRPDGEQFETLRRMPGSFDATFHQAYDAMSSQRRAEGPSSSPRNGRQRRHGYGQTASAECLLARRSSAKPASLVTVTCSRRCRVITGTFMARSLHHQLYPATWWSMFDNASARCSKT